MQSRDNRLNRIILGAFFALSLFCAMGAQAQPLETGIWTGEVIAPHGQVTEVVFEVAAENGTLKINLLVPNGDRYSFDDIKHKDGTLIFEWQVEALLQCALEGQDDGSYEGACRDAKGDAGQVIMMPPKEEKSIGKAQGMPDARAGDGIPGPRRIRWGEGGYIEYTVGDLPLILSAPHGGTLTPRKIRDRARGYTIGDSDTQELTRLIAQALTDLTGRRPHMVISRLSRVKLDANRGLREAANGDAIAERAWFDYHGFIDDARKAVSVSWGSGLYLDIHGHGHRIPRIELGYEINTKDLNGPDEALDTVQHHALRALTEATSTSLSELIRGPESLGALLEDRGYHAVPSPSNPGPAQADYFVGGYSTHRHGSFSRGSISSVLVEHPRQGVRDDPADRRSYARHLAEVLVEFMEAHYGFRLRR